MRIGQARSVGRGGKCLPFDLYSERESVDADSLVLLCNGGMKPRTNCAINNRIYL